MALRVVGAGVGRTGTHSLKLAIEQLTGAPCYHMVELIGNREAVPVWHAAIDGTMPDWEQFLAGYQATVDWPACAVWRELAHAYPDAPVLLSTRSSTEAWYGSMERTIMQAVSQPTEDADHARHRALTMAMRCERPTSSTTRWSAAWWRRDAWWSGSRATAGSRSAVRWRCRCRTSRSHT